MVDFIESWFPRPAKATKFGWQAEKVTLNWFSVRSNIQQLGDRTINDFERIWDIHSQIRNPCDALHGYSKNNVTKVLPAAILK